MPDINLSDTEYMIPSNYEKPRVVVPSRPILHWSGCWSAGPDHYECALAEIARLQTMLQLPTANKDQIGLFDVEQPTFLGAE